MTRRVKDERIEKILRVPKKYKLRVPKEFNSYWFRGTCIPSMGPVTMTGKLPVSHPPPLVGLCRVRVDADCSVAISDGCVGLLHLDEDAVP